MTKALTRGIQKLLDKYVPEPKIPLDFKSTYTLLIAVLLSAQCTDERVNKVTKILFQHADTAEKMMQLPLDLIQEIIRPCGLSLRKATAIKTLSEILVEKYKGKVPNTLEALEALPGVGHKTASVVLTQAFHEPAFPVDTHIFRSARRWGLSQKKTREGVEKDLKKLFPEKDWARLHLQITLYARKFCPAKKHEPKSCPICTFSEKR
jgi:endonuclease III